MADLITSTYAKQALQQDTSFSAAEDGVIAALATACSEAIRSFCKREFDSQSFTERYDGVDDTRLVLRQYPVVSVKSPEVDGTALSQAEDPLAHARMLRKLADKACRRADEAERAYGNGQVVARFVVML